MKKILVIEDDEPIRNITTKLLTVHGYQTAAANDGLTGLQRAREYLPELIICDLMMPNLDGYAVLEMLRKDPITASVPFIIMTAKNDRAAMRRGMELGADDYLTKPITSSELIATVKARLEKQAVMAQISQKKLDDLRERIMLALPHEVRTPLNTILGFSDLLTTNSATMDHSQLVDVGQRINRSAWRLWRLVENYLVYAQIELMKSNEESIRALQQNCTGNVKIMIEDQAVQRAHKVGRRADLMLNVDDVNAVRISENHLQKIISELIDNAFKFSPSGTPVEVRAQALDHQYNIRITDHGRGMTPEQIANIGAYMQFERRMYEQQGTGLGLVIAKDLTGLYGGKLAIESVPNKQTSVTVALVAS